MLVYVCMHISGLWVSMNVCALFSVVVCVLVQISVYVVNML